MKIAHLTVLALGACLLMATAAPAAEGPSLYYIAINGNDAWSGRLAAPNDARTDGPLASLAARGMRSAGASRENRRGHGASARRDVSA